MVKKVHKDKKSSKSFETFGEYIEEQEVQEEIESESESDTDSKPKSSLKTIMRSDVKKIIKASQENINHSRKLLKLFRSACHTNDENAADFESPETFNLIITASLKKFPKIFKKAFRDKDLKPSSKTSFKNLLRSFLSNTLFLLKQVRGNVLLVAIYKSLTRISKFFSFFPDFPKNFVKISAKIWGESEKSGKLITYNFMRNVMEKKLFDGLEVLKLLYVNYAKNSKFLTWVNYLSTETMRNCFVDILGLDLSASYQVIFISLRKLASFLSQTVKDPSSDRIKTIYNWQYLNCLILMGRSISLYKDLSDLTSPLIQIITGVLSLTNIPKYFPLKLHLVHILISLQNHCKIYIPAISPNVLEIITSPSLMKSTSNKNLKEFSFFVAIKASKDQLSSELYREQIIDECCECLIQHFGSISNAVAFPEIEISTRVTLKKHCKNLRNSVFREKILHCLRIVAENSEWVKSQRKGIGKVTDKIWVEGNPPIKEKCEKIIKRRQDILNSKI